MRWWTWGLIAGVLAGLVPWTFETAPLRAQGLVWPLVVAAVGAVAALLSDREAPWHHALYGGAVAGASGLLIGAALLATRLDDLGGFTWSASPTRVLLGLVGILAIAMVPAACGAVVGLVGATVGLRAHELRQEGKEKGA